MPSKGLTIQLISISPGVYEVTGDLTFNTVSQLQTLPEQVSSSATTPKIMLDKVQHIDSAGLALLIDWGRQSMQYHSITFCQPNKQLLRLVDLYNLESVLSFDHSI
ncbi:MAG TPA: STAS domain-containing protein [Crenotrichaceae bacterium]|nr:STAS domain-containing protein [Crenotrichaceae bacterium]